MKRLLFILLPLALAACSQAELGNIALNRTAVASSNYDYNLTAQLATDGIVHEGEPAFIEVNSSDGPVSRVERENALDGDRNSRNIITGQSGWLEWRFHGYEVLADKAEVLYQEALKGGRGGPEHTVSVPLSVQEDGALRLDMDFPHEGRWRVKSVDFYKDGVSLGNLLPSEHFTSAWKSDEGQEQWICVDLGSVRKVCEVKPHWIDAPEQWTVEASKDGSNWKAFSKGRWRYVRLLIQGPACLTELEVMDPEKKEPSEKIWKIVRASEVHADGAAMSSPGFDDSSWLPATVPGTVLANYIRAGAVPDPAFGDNWSQISDSFFNSDFWYRLEFDWAPGGKRTFIDFDGINWKADIWLNGSKLGRIEGAFMRGHFDASALLKEGRNALAVRVERNAHPGAVKEKTAKWTGYNGGVLGADNPTFHASIGWDWMTTVRGRNCGIWNDVRMVEKGPAEVMDPVIVSTVGPDGSASMRASVIVSGCTGRKVELEGWIGDIHFSKEVEEDGEAVFSPEEFPQLKNKEMELWWPVGYGEPRLYDAGFEVKVNGVLSDSLHFKAGIREMRWDSTDGVLKLYVNGRRFIPQGGNWGFSEQNLIFGAREYDIALNYHRQMKMNIIRNWVGQVADEEFYEACDRHGVMVWQDFWLANPGDGPNPDDEEMFLANAADWVRRIRRHPCLALYCGRNEGDPPASLDKALRENVVARLHPGMLYISNSADGIVSGHGPYKAMPTDYYFSDQSGKLHSERGLPCVGTWESLQRMMEPRDRWPQGEMWGKHDFTTDGAQSVKTYNGLIEDNFGKASSAEEFCHLAQWLNYEGYRAIFESANSAGRKGVILWMSHSSWPSLVFCTYDYFFEPSGAFFGSKKGCEPLHIQYNALTREVEVVNLCCGLQAGLKAELEIYDYMGRLLGSESATLDSPDDSTVSCFRASLPDGEAVFLKLRLLASDGGLMSENFYMVPATGVTHGLSGGLKLLRTLPPAKISRKMSVSGNDIRLTLKNEDSVPAYLVRLILKDRKGNEILPINYSDNYFALLPGEEKTVEISFSERADSPILELKQLGDFQRSEMDLICEGVSALSAKQCLLLGSQLEDGTMPQTFEDGVLVTSGLERWTRQKQLSRPCPRRSILPLPEKSEASF